MTKKFLSLLLLGLLCSIGNMWGAINNTTVTKAGGTQKYLDVFTTADSNGDEVTVKNNYIAYTVNELVSNSINGVWYTQSSGGSGSSNSDAVSVEGYRSSCNKYIGVNSSKYYTHYVTKCTSFAVLYDPRANNRYLTITATNVDDVKDVLTITNSGTISSGNKYNVVLTGLDASKYYSVVVKTDNGSDSRLYQIRLGAPPASYSLEVSATPDGYGTVSASSISDIEPETALSTSSTTLTVAGKSPITATATSQTAQYTYAFDHWQLSSGASLPSTVTDNLSVQAVFTRAARTYDVTLHTNGGTINSGNVTTYTFGVGATLPTDITKDDFDFAGWFDNDGLAGDPVEVIADNETGNQEYWAKWNAAAAKFDIAFAKGDYSAYAGSFPSDENVSNVILAELSSDNNYRFDGWKANVAVKEGTIDGETISAGTLIVADTKVFVTAATTFTAQWTPKFAVSFNSVGGSAVETQYVVSGGVAEEPTAPTRLNYTFTGWQLGGVDYNFSSTVSGAITLDATWSRNSISGPTTDVVISSGKTVNTGGTLSVSVSPSLATNDSPAGVKFGGNITSGENNPTRYIQFTVPFGSTAEVKTLTVSSNNVIIRDDIGGTTLNEHVFYKSDDLGNYNKSLIPGTYYIGRGGSTSVMTACTLTLTSSPLTVTFKVEGEDDQVITVTSGETLGNLFVSGELPTLGDGFLGWKNEEDDADVAASTVISSTMVIYAVFEAAPRTVTFNAGDNGSCGTTSLTEVSAEAGITLPIIEANTGYVFNGWYTAESEGTKAGDAGDTYYPSRNLTLYAQYSRLYTVTYSAGTGSGTVPTESDKVEGAEFTLANQGSLIAPASTYFGGWNDGTSNYAAGANYIMPNKNVALTAIWKPYAQSIDLEMEAATRDAADDKQTFTYLSDHGYEYSGFASTEYENHAGTKDCYKGLKLKDKGAMITFYVPAGKVVRIWLGQVKALPSITINGTAQRVNVVTDNEGYYHQELQYITTEHSKIVLTTASSGTVTLQNILISETYTRPVAAEQYGTICLPYDVAAGQFSGVEFFGIEGTIVVEENITGVVLTEAKTSLVAGTPYIFFAASAGTLSTTISGTAASVQPATGLVGNLNPTSSSVDNTKFIIYENQLRMVNGATVTCPQYRAYIDLSEVGEASLAPGYRVVMVENEENNATNVDAIGASEKAIKFIENGLILIKKDGIVYDALGRVVK